MEFVNHTPFPALAFAGIDQFDQGFHVLVLRQTLTWGDDGELIFADSQAPLCEVDEYFGAMNASSVRVESDLCQYKPKCDVIVNATAYAPQMTGPAQSLLRRFEVRLVVKRPDTPAPLPPEPQGLNPLTSASPAERAQWRAAAAHAQAHAIPGQRLIDKTLTVTGERWFREKQWPFRLFWWVLKWASLGLIRRNPWKLTAPQKLTALPLRYEYAFGGQCRIDAGDNAAKRVNKKLRLTPEQQAQHPDQPAPIAHTVCELNPIGLGYSEAWHLKASKQKRVAAPQIETPTAPISAKLFWHAQNGKLKREEAPLAAFTPAGLSVNPKSHPARRKLGGTIDTAFIQSDKWLPDDFDFGVWNAAPSDQQIEFLQGDEIIELTNLCAPSTPGATTDPRGNTQLTLTLPANVCFSLVRLDSGEMFIHPLQLDTVIVEPETANVSLVWRTVLAQEPDAPIRAIEARLQSRAEYTQLQAEIERITQVLNTPAETAHAE